MEFLKNSLKKSIEITLFLIKVTVPISLVIKVLSDFGLIKIIAGFFSPVMKIVGLSGELGIVWITAMLTNIYGGIITLFNFSNTIDFSVKEISLESVILSSQETSNGATNPSNERPESSNFRIMSLCIPDIRDWLSSIDVA